MLIPHCVSIVLLLHDFQQKMRLNMPGMPGFLVNDYIPFLGLYIVT